MLWITDTISIADWELSESFVRASGPGGQNVNKVSTAVELRFEAERSPNLAPGVKARLKKL
ncbi:MAG: peptide chain release factor-like protein, partial [Cypionkella sp.]|nr:peptide chain release factor-like protein [Cypionkella sp.]